MPIVYSSMELLRLVADVLSRIIRLGLHKTRRPCQDDVAVAEQILIRVHLITCDAYNLKHRDQRGSIAGWHLWRDSCIELHQQGAQRPAHHLGSLAL
jgi:hypothetical protein